METSGLVTAPHRAKKDKLWSWCSSLNRSHHHSVHDCGVCRWSQSDKTGSGWSFAWTLVIEFPWIWQIYWCSSWSLAWHVRSIRCSDYPWCSGGAFCTYRAWLSSTGEPRTIWGCPQGNISQLGRKTIKNDSSPLSWRGVHLANPKYPKNNPPIIGKGRNNTSLVHFPIIAFSCPEREEMRWSEPWSWDTLRLWVRFPPHNRRCFCSAQCPCGTAWWTVGINT